MIFRVVGGKPGTASAVQLFVAETAKDSLGNNSIQPDSDLTGDQKPKKGGNKEPGKDIGRFEAGSGFLAKRQQQLRQNSDADKKRFSTSAGR